MQDHVGYILSSVNLRQVYYGPGRSDTMRRVAYPYGRYLLRGGSVEDLAPRVQEYVRSFGYPITRYDTRNEGRGTLIVAVNKTVAEARFDGAHLDPLFIIARALHGAVPSFGDLDPGAQRVGIEFYLWPVDEGVLLEVFVLPYMEHMDRKEIYGVTQSEMEEVADWYLTERIWAEISPGIESDLGAEPLLIRGQ